MKIKKIVSAFTSAIIAASCAACAASFCVSADDAITVKNTDMVLRLDAEKTNFTLEEIGSGNAKTKVSLYADNFNDAEKITVIMAGFGVSNDGIKISNIRFPDNMGITTESKKGDADFALAAMRFNVAADDDTCNFFIQGDPTDPMIADDLSRPVVEFDVSFAKSMAEGKYEINFDNATANKLCINDPDNYGPTEIEVQSGYEFRTEEEIANSSVPGGIMVSSYSESARKNAKSLEITIGTPKNEENFIRGDISGNGKVDLYDAIEIAKSLIGVRKFTEEEIKIADFNEDGKIDLYDAIAIAKYMLKK